MTVTDDRASAADKAVDAVDEAFEAEKEAVPLVSRIGQTALYLALAAFMVWLAIEQPGKVGSTAVRVVVAVGLSAAIFIGANKLFDSAETSWRRFSGIAGAAMGGLVFMILDGNRLLRDISATDEFSIGKIWQLFFMRPFTWGLVGALAVGAVIWLLSGTEPPQQRLAVGVGGMAAVGVVAGIGTNDITQPAISWGPAVLVAAIFGAIFGGLGFVRGSLGERGTPQEHSMRYGVVGVAFGWLLGLWAGADIGAGSPIEAVIAFAVPFAFVGFLLGSAKPSTDISRGQVSVAARKWIFLAPAMTFIIGGLVIPLIRTIYLSLFNDNSTEFVWFDNFREIFTNDNSFDLSGWADFFTSRLFFFGLALVLVGTALGLMAGSRRKSGFEANGSSLPPIVFGIFLASFGLFSVLRGTVLNNIWWVLVVTSLATAFGLAIAVLSDRAGLESVAKSLIFMPMAISFVGAGIIWRFVYLPRDVSKPQTGVLNSLWVWLGELSTGNGSTVWASIFVIVLGLFAAGLLFLSYQGFRASASGVAWGSAVAAVVPLVLLYFFLFPGLGGRTTNSDGEYRRETILFLQEGPFNNVWLMVVLIWIQTGFAMVIFSAAIKAVPSELIEAAKVDGATESQVFWRVTVPQIAPTIGVVVTTLIVTVMKVFDIVKVMTNGNFGTQVIANEMWQRAFTELNFGLGSALAVVLFLSVLPIMYFNIRRMQEATV